MPIGIQSFSELRKNEQVYVDKTAFVHQLAYSFNPFFLARPRRFGKSLLISTLDAFFRGQRELFEGLAIAELEHEWEEFPILHIDLNGADYTDTKVEIETVYEDGSKSTKEVDALTAKLHQILVKYEAIWGVRSNAGSVSSRLQNLIEKMASVAGKNGVVLIDEYDKPLLETLEDETLHDAYRNTLRAFYGVLKSVDQYLRFVLITGVTKFSKVSIFSDMNQLRDISLENGFSAVCGITEEELQETFKPEIRALADNLGYTYDEALARLKEEYDGYHFSKNSPDIYNPYSVINTFAKLDFSDYWFQSGTPTFLIKLIRQSNFDTLQFQGEIMAGVDEMTDFRYGSPNLLPVLFQSGYLTIRSYDRDYDAYMLGFPNKEVEQGFLKSLLPMYLDQKAAVNDSDFDVRLFVRDLAAQNIDAFINRLRALFSAVPHGEDAEHEHYYQSIFYIIFSLMGQFVTAEEHTYKGRSDAVVQTKDAIFVFEFKLSSGDSDKVVQSALDQIEQTGYAERYAASPKKVYKIGVQFDPEKRNITGWQVL
jgi:hypothetical protein